MKGAISTIIYKIYASTEKGWLANIISSFRLAKKGNILKTIKFIICKAFFYKNHCHLILFIF